MNKLLKEFAAVAAAVVGSCALGETLDTLTLNGTSYSATENSTIGVLTVTDGSTGNVIAIPGGITVTVSSYEGGGALSKTGAGLLVLSDVTSSADITAEAGTLRFVNSNTAVDTATPASSSALHLDADNGASISTTGTGDNTLVTAWADVRGSSVNSFTPTTWSYKKQPYYRLNVQNGRAVVDCGSARKKVSGSYVGGYGGWLMGTAVSGIKDVFVVLSDFPEDTPYAGTSGARSLLTYVGANKYDFYRSDTALYSGSSRVKDCPTWIDGKSVDPETTNLSAGFHLARTRIDSLTDVSANALCNDRSDSTGGLLYGEVIAFTTTIDEATAERISRRLTWKWFNRRSLAKLVLKDGAALELNDGGVLTPAALTVPATASVTGTGSLTAPAGSNLTKVVLPNEGTLNVAAGGRTDVYVLDAAEKLTKTGSGELRVMALSSTKVDVREGSLSFELQTDMLNPAFHGDASRTDRMSHWYNTLKKRETIDKWYDLRDSILPCNKLTDLPFYNLEGTNGLAYIDFGPATSKGASLQLDGNVATAKKFEMFFVASDTQSAYDSSTFAPFLGVYGQNVYDMIRGGTYGTSSALFRSAYGNDHTMIDGEPAVNTSLLPRGFHVIHWRMNDSYADGISGNVFARDRNSYSGGMLMGETLLYTNRIDATECTKVNNYLINKWLDGSKPGPTLASVNVEGGASVTLPVRSTVEALSGAGSVSAKHVTLGSFDTVYGAPRSITGDVKLAATGTINLTGAVGVKLRGPVAVLTATAGITADSLRGWTVITDRIVRGPCKLSISGGALVADFKPLGLFIAIK